MYKPLNIIFLSIVTLQFAFYNLLTTIYIYIYRHTRKHETCQYYKVNVMDRIWIMCIFGDIKLRSILTIFLRLEMKLVPNRSSLFDKKYTTMSCAWYKSQHYVQWTFTLFTLHSSGYLEQNSEKDPSSCSLLM